MTEKDIIIVDGIDDLEYESLIENCVKYAIISLPFTVDRMAIPDEKQRALNIAKGKVAEALFEYFCKKNNICPDFEICSTPFWTVDKRDFLLNGLEWDIKNNFIYCPNHLYHGNYIELPALIPNRFNGDQWTKKSNQMIQNSLGVNYLFTFLKNASLVNGIRSSEFLEIQLSTNQQNLLRNLYSKYNGMPQNSEPFSQEWFWSEMSKLGITKFYNLNFKPQLVITGYADKNNWNLFKDTGPFDRNNNWQTNKLPRWYLKTSKGSCNFLNGTLWTTITNATLPVENLSSFIDLFPNLKNEIICGRIKN
jgi:hypothetical protein